MSQPADGLSCAVVVDLLEEWIDGELAGTDAAAIEAHLERCASCSEERTLAEQVREGLRSLPELDTPPRVLEAVRSAARPRSAERLRSLFEKLASRPVPALAAVAATVLLVLAVLPWRDRSAPQYTEDEIRRAAVETKIALAYVGEISHRAERKVRHVIDEKAVDAAARGISRSLEWTGGVRGGLPASVTPEKNGEGSS
jgi:predicted anti-sigma-YlaC factor YlaD